MRKCLVLTILFMAFAFLSRAQNKEVTGRVTDSTGNPLSGASIKIKGARGGTSAGPDGGFRIMAPASGTLVVSAVGFGSREFSIGGQSEITVQLFRDTRSMSEVVVTALGIKREKRSLGYATQTIGADQLNTTGTGNALNELSGKASGLTVINSAGDPGAGTFMLLRGVTSVTGNNQPLMVVDGVPIDNSANNFDPQFNGFQAGGAGADLVGASQPTNRGLDLNPNDIESITLLKGPAATALYGIQAASGALVITTKKGGAHKAQVSFNSSVTWDRHTQLPPLQTKFAQGDFDGTNYVYEPPSSGQPFSWGPAIDTLYWDGTNTNPWDKHGNIVGKSDPSAKNKVVPYDTYSFFKTGMVLDNNIAVAGGTPDAGYRMSYGNLYQTGIIPKTRYAKNTFNLSGQMRVSPKVSLQGAMTFINSSNDKAQQGSNTSGIMLGLLRTTPTFDNSNGLKDPWNNRDAYLFPNGKQRSYRGFGKYDNPYYTINNNPTTSNLNRIFGYGQVNYQANDWLGFTYRLGGDLYNQSDKSAFGSQSGAYHLPVANGALFLTTYYNQQFNSDFTVNLKHSFGDLNASLLLGHNFFDLQSNNRLVKAVGLLINDFNDVSNAAAPVNTQFDGHKRTQAYYGDLELSWRNMLYLGITGRREETSTLAPANNVFWYPSASLGWVFTELESLKGRDVLNYGKVRVNFAQVGKDAPIYALTTQYAAPFAFTDGFVNTGVSIPGYALSTNVATLGNPNLKAEKTRSYEAGVDLGLYKDRITFNGTYYYSKSTDVIVPVAISYTTGFAGQLLNAATIQNKGVELTLNTNPVRTSYGLRWDVNFNWSMNRNKVLKLAPGLDRILLAGFGAGEFEIDAVAGQPYGVIYGNTTPHSNLTDLKSPLLINDNPKDPNNEVGQPIGGGVGPNMVIGDPNPKWLGSVQSNLSYKGFTLGVQVNIKHGGNIMNGTRGAITLRGTAKQTENRGTATVFKGLLGHLNAAGQVVHYEGSGPNPPEKSGPGAVNTIQSSYDYNYWKAVGNSVGGGQEVDIEDGGYTKLRQISLTYQLPKSIINKMKFSALSFTIFANNIHTWTKYDGVDPETSLAGPSNAQGMDFFNNPGIRNYGIRLNVGL